MIYGFDARKFKSTSRWYRWQTREAAASKNGPRRWDGKWSDAWFVRSINASVYFAPINMLHTYHSPLGIGLIARGSLCVWHGANRCQIGQRRCKCCCHCEKNARNLKEVKFIWMVWTSPALITCQTLSQSHKSKGFEWRRIKNSQHHFVHMFFFLRFFLTHSEHTVVQFFFVYSLSLLLYWCYSTCSQKFILPHRCATAHSFETEVHEWNKSRKKKFIWQKRRTEKVPKKW